MLNPGRLLWRGAGFTPEEFLAEFEGFERAESLD